MLINILITGVKSEVLAKIKELVKEEENRKPKSEIIKELRNDILGHLKDFEKKWSEETEEYKRDVKKMNKRFAEGKPAEDIRKFNEDMIDREYDRIQDEELSL